MQNDTNKNTIVQVGRYLAPGCFEGFLVFQKKDKYAVVNESMAGTMWRQDWTDEEIYNHFSTDYYKEYGTWEEVVAKLTELGVY